MIDDEQISRFETKHRTSFISLDLNVATIAQILQDGRIIDLNLTESLLDNVKMIM